MTDTPPKIGQIITGEEQRDAVHIAVAPVTAAYPMEPGEHIGLDDNGRASNHAAKNIGIVDPYLNDDVQQGQRFFMFLYPGTITSLNHLWTHPDFDVKPDAEQIKRRSEDWIIALCSQVGISYDDILEHAENTAANGFVDYYTGGSSMEGEIVPDEFWEHYENVTGKKAPKENRESFFSCSC